MTDQPSRARKAAPHPAVLATTDLHLAATDHGSMLTHLADQVIGKALRDRGGFQQGDMDRAIAFLAARGQPVARSVFVDVGAHVGPMSLQALAMGFQRAICIEPDPVNARLLAANLHLNGLGQRATVL